MQQHQQRRRVPYRRGHAPNLGSLPEDASYHLDCLGDPSLEDSCSRYFWEKRRTGDAASWSADLLASSSSLQSLLPH